MLSGPILQPLNASAPDSMVVILHGYGADGQDLISLGEIWQSALPNTLFWAPNGLEPCDMYPSGYQWFGLRDLDPLNIRAGLDRAAPLVATALSQEIAKYNLSPSQVVLVGFSQGTMLALDLIFKMPTLKGALGYSGAFYNPKITSPIPSSEVFLIHGTLDTIVPYPSLMLAEKELSQMGIKVVTHTCLGAGHEINHEGIAKGQQFLTQLFN